MRTSCSPCSCLTMSSKHLDQWGHWHQRGVRVRGCVRGLGIEERERKSLTACVLCVCGCLPTCKLVLVSLLRAESWGHREGPLPLTGPPSGFLQATKECPQRPSSSCRTLRFIPETQRKKASSGLTATCTPNTQPAPACFIWTFIALADRGTITAFYWLNSEEGCSP